MKQRVTITLDADLVAAGSRAVAAGQADSMSGWVNNVLAERTARDKRLAALGAAVAAYEAEHGEITAEERAEQRRIDRDAAAAVRAGSRPQRASG